VLVVAMLSYSRQSGNAGPGTELVNEVVPDAEAEMLAYFDEQTADPIAFLLEDNAAESATEIDLTSDGEDLLLDWAVDGELEDDWTADDLLDLF
jgi:hypothetical protein